MIVPQHLRLSLFCAQVHTVVVREDRAWVCGAKDEIDLDFENVQELVDLGILEINPRAQTGGEGMIGAHVVRGFGSRTSAYGHVDPLPVAFAATFADGVLPSHPGLWETGDEDTASYTVYETVETMVEGAFESDGRIVLPVKTIEPVIRSQYGETFFYTRTSPNSKYGFIGKYRTGVVGPVCHMDAFMLATLRCVIEHDVYSSGHVFIDRLDSGKPYQGALGSSGLYAMIRFGLVKAKGMRVDKWSAEHYEATDLGRRCYEAALPNLSGFNYLKYWNEVATAMGWEK